MCVFLTGLDLVAHHFGQDAARLSLDDPPFCIRELERVADHVRGEKNAVDAFQVGSL